MPPTESTPNTKITATTIRTIFSADPPAPAGFAATGVAPAAGWLAGTPPVRAPHFPQNPNCPTRGAPQLPQKPVIDPLLWRSSETVCAVTRGPLLQQRKGDRKSTRLNSSHL